MMSHSSDKNNFLVLLQYDINRDGFLSKKELKNLIKQNPGQCNDLPKGIHKAMLKMHDGNNDGQLDFEEFFKLSQEHNWIIHDWAVKYCRYVIPRRDGSVHDETGESKAIVWNAWNF